MPTRSPEPPGSLDPLLTPEDLSAIVVIPLATIHQWSHRGGGPPALKIGRHLRYRRSDVDRWLESKRSSAQ